MLAAVKREILLAPNLVARAAATATDDPAARWMLSLPLAVRRSYVADVLDRGDGEAEQRVWMLLQADPVREGYIRAVLERGAEPPGLEVLWMLRQPESVRASYVRDVIRKPGPIRPDVVWMLRQPDSVRESYLAQVVLAQDTGGS